MASLEEKPFYQFGAGRMTPAAFQAKAQAYRAATGLSMRQWAKRLNVSVGSISMWESGLVVPAHPEAVLLLMEQTAQRCAAERKG